MSEEYQALKLGMARITTRVLMIVGICDHGAGGHVTVTMKAPKLRLTKDKIDTDEVDYIDAGDDGGFHGKGV